MHHCRIPPYEYKNTFDHFFEHVIFGKSVEGGINGSENGDWFDYHEPFFQKYYQEREQDPDGMYWSDQRDVGQTKGSYSSASIFIITYEEMKSEPIEAIKKIAEYSKLTKNVSHRKIDQITYLTSVKKMQDNASKHGFQRNDPTTDMANAVNYKRSNRVSGNKNKGSNMHIRKGEVGDWVNYFSDEQLEKWRQYVFENMERAPCTVRYLGLGYLLGETEKFWEYRRLPEESLDEYNHRHIIVPSYDYI